MLPKKLRQKSKVVSYILRHNPVKLKKGIDKEGWADLKEVLQLSTLTLKDINLILKDSDKNPTIKS